MLQYLPFLRRAGIDVEVQTLWDETYLDRLYQRRGARRSIRHAALRYARRALFWPRHARRVDVVWLEGELFPWLPAIAERFSPAPIVVDYDDAHFHKYDTHPLAQVFLGSKVDNIMRAAAAVVVGNPYLRDRARAAGARLVELLPTVVDLERWPRQAAEARADHAAFRVGWIGTPHTAPYLDAIAGALRRASALIPLRAILVGSDRRIPGVDVEHRAWHETTEARDVASFSIGVMPLPDRPWERGKSGYKLIQYMASSRAVVASPVGVNRDLVAGCGVLATTEDEWVDALVALARDPERRAAMGARGRARVEREYSVTVTAPRLVDLFRRICGRAR